MNFEQRTAEIFEFLYNPQAGLLRSYTAPEHLSQDRQRTEINNMVEDMNSEIPSDVNEGTLNLILERTARHVRKKHAGRSWPTIRTLCAAIKAACDEGFSQDDQGGEDRAIDMLQEWFERTGRCFSALAREDRTEALIKRGLFNAREARFRGFPLSPDRKAEVKDQAPSKAEWSHHVATMANLWGCSTNEAEARLLQEKRQRIEFKEPNLADLVEV